METKEYHGFERKIMYYIHIISLYIYICFKHECIPRSALSEIL